MRAPKMVRRYLAAVLKLRAVRATLRALEVLAAFAVVLLVFVLVVGCAGAADVAPVPATLTEADVFAATMPAMCDRFAACDPSAFKARFGSRAGCVDAVAHPPHPDAPANCTRAELDACVSDITAESCTQVSSTRPFPESCGKCNTT